MIPMKIKPSLKMRQGFYAAMVIDSEAKTL